MGLVDQVGVRELGFLVASAIGGVVLGVGITKLASRTTGKKVKFSRKLKLYHQHVHKSARVKWAVEELGLGDACEIIPYNPYTASAEDKAWYKANVHPNGLIPALELPSGDIMYEGAAICMYLAETQQQLLSPPGALHDYYSWSTYASCTLEPSVHTLYKQNFILGAGQRDPTLQRTETQRVLEGMAELDKHLQDRNYICGDSFTMADVIVGYTIMFASTINGGQLLVDHPKVKGYLERLKTRPCFGPSMGTLREWIQGGSE